MADSPAPRRERRPGPLHPGSRRQSPGWDLPEAGQPLPDWPGLHENFSFEFRMDPEIGQQPAEPKYPDSWMLILLIFSALFAIFSVIIYMLL